MLDQMFMLTVLGNISPDSEWHDLISHLRDRIGEYDAHQPKPIPITSAEFITGICDESWFHNQSSAQSNAYLFSARTTEEKRAPKCPCAAEPSSTVAATPAKHLHIPNDKTCTNPNCSGKRGHTFQECMVYGGGSQGKYTLWWRGPWNIHLPADQCCKANNVLPPSHPAYNKPGAPPKPTVYYAIDAGSALLWASPSPSPSTTDNEVHINTVTTNEIPAHNCNMALDSDIIIASLPILDNAMTWNDACHHNSRANHHVFHDRATFEMYQPIEPLCVKGFSKGLVTMAIGRGMICILGWYGQCSCNIVLHNVLHIPAAHSNLISGTLLDKAGVSASVGEVWFGSV
jgi:hypothetical protein